jgi:hypothetical protein
MPTTTCRGSCRWPYYILWFKARSAAEGTQSQAVIIREVPAHAPGVAKLGRVAQPRLLFMLGDSWRRAPQAPACQRTENLLGRTVALSAGFAEGGT